MDHHGDVRGTLCAVLAVCCRGLEFAPDKGLIAQGLGSLAATRFALEAEARLGVPVPVDILGADISLDELVTRIEGARGAARPVAPSAPAGPRPAAVAGEVPLLPLQQAYLVTSDPGYTADPVGCHIYREYEF